MKDRITMLALVFLAYVLMAPSGARGCLWDSDTLSQEAQDQMDVVGAIVGWFNRYPPLYYEMRIKIAATKIEQNADDLNAYDDAAVACDRVGRGDEALEWMDKKARRLEAMKADDPRVRHHRYRWLANTGTFWVHRWARNGADRQKIDEVEKARDLIRQAIDLNPNAHFGREKYQLKFLEWIIAGHPKRPQTQPATSPSAAGATTRPAAASLFALDGIGLLRSVWPINDEFDSDPSMGINQYLLFRKEGEGSLESLGFGDAAKGIAGLVMLGNAWESVDAFVTLWIVEAAEGNWTVCDLTQCRIEELLNSGKGSLSPAYANTEELRATLNERVFKFSRATEVKPVRDYYRIASAAAKARQEALLAFMMPRLEAGRHPDTDAHFWDGYQSPKIPAPPGELVVDEEAQAKRLLKTYLAGLLFFPIVFALGIFVISRRRKRKAQMYRALQLTQSENP